MGAKASLLLIAAFAAAGCSGALQRFAPPGIVKYEELAGDEPVHPAIAERVEERREEGGEGFPPLAEQPTKTPEGIAKPERAAMEEALIAERDALNTAVADDRAEAAAERTDSLEVPRGALMEKAAKDGVDSREELGPPPGEPIEQVE